MTYLLVDVSNVNGNIDFGAVRESMGATGVFLKATEGLTFDDPKWPSFRSAANAAGLRVGAYHFARPDLHPYDPDDEADHFCRIVGSIGRRDLRPVLDFEHTATINGAQMTAWARLFNQRVKKNLGVLPIFYSYPSFISDMRPSTPIGAGLWLASYGSNDGADHPYGVPAPWHKAIAHQFSSNGRLAGHSGSVDVSHAPSLTPLLAHPVIGRLPAPHRYGKRALR